MKNFTAVIITLLIVNSLIGQLNNVKLGQKHLVFENSSTIPLENSRLFYADIHKVGQYYILYYISRDRNATLNYTRRNVLVAYSTNPIDSGFTRGFPPSAMSLPDSGTTNRLFNFGGDCIDVISVVGDTLAPYRMFGNFITNGGTNLANEHFYMIKLAKDGVTMVGNPIRIGSRLDSQYSAVQLASGKIRLYMRKWVNSNTNRKIAVGTIDYDITSSPSTWVTTGRVLIDEIDYVYGSAASGIEIDGKHLIFPSHFQEDSLPSAIECWLVDTANYGAKNVNIIEQPQVIDNPSNFTLTYPGIVEIGGKQYIQIVEQPGPHNSFSNNSYYNSKISLVSLELNFGNSDSTDALICNPHYTSFSELTTGLTQNLPDSGSIENISLTDTAVIIANTVIANDGFVQVLIDTLSPVQEYVFGFVEQGSITSNSNNSSFQYAIRVKIDSNIHAWKYNTLTGEQDTISGLWENDSLLALQVGDKLRIQRIGNKIVWRRIRGASIYEFANKTDDLLASKSMEIFAYMPPNSKIKKMESYSSQICIGNTVGIKKETYNYENEVNIYPNPSNGQVNIELSDMVLNKISTLKVMSTNSSNVLINYKNINQNKLKIDLTSLSQGTYIVSFILNDGKKLNFPVVKF